jgi:hypothetical protein
MVVDAVVAEIVEVFTLVRDVRVEGEEGSEKGTIFVRFLLSGDGGSIADLNERSQSPS